MPPPPGEARECAVGAAARAMLLSTWSFGRRGHEAAWPELASGGSSLDAVEAACRAVEADPEVDSVGYGGLPDRDGHVTLDGCIMVAPDQCGSVCAIRRHRHPVSIARQVMERTAHVMLAGAAADDFADACGFEPAPLLSDAARQAWTQWMRDPKPIDQSADAAYAPARPQDQAGAGRLFPFTPLPSPPPAPNDEDRWKHHDTISVLALDARGALAGACSTSGTPFKQPGRIGDAPVIGHGLYVDPACGAAAATGTGELITGVCGSFLVVELMRAGRPPLEAVVEVLRRIRDAFDLQPEHQVALIALAPDGGHAAGALRPGYRSALRTPERDEIIEPDVVLMET
ncbi:MAG: isoaspartyl peptidase/L-asparaginase [Planctomycetota bacterium]|jgi:isoaspartyl peptidase/L-asparaginase-like protein (Ntn-hydrolase superfamily)